jgi:hypothetical protein
LWLRRRPGDRAVSTGRQGWPQRHELERRDAITYRIERGKIARMEYFNDQRLALEAVGLRG